MLADDPLPILLINAACALLAGGIARRSGFYRRLLARPADGRCAMIDGLRGWLALAVFFTHGAAMYGLLGGEGWNAYASGLYGRFGQAGVALFFMITGFLFWGRVLRGRGRLDAQALYRARLRRLVPMYLVSVLLVGIVVLVAGGPHLQVSPGTLAREARAWLSFGFLPADSLNGLGQAHYINAVYWTLAFEWTFYLALPLLALAARGWRAWLVFPLATLYALHVPVTLNFLGGALVAVLLHARLPWRRLAHPLWAPLPVLALAGALFAFPTPFAPLAVLLLATFFLFVAAGNSLFGLLATRPAQLLGAVSYSLYLLHCIALYSIVHVADRWWPVVTMGAAAYWSLTAVAALVTVALAALSFRWVEHPFMAGTARPALARPVEAQALA